MAGATFGWRACPIRRSRSRPTPSSASPRPRSAAPTCICTRCWGCSSMKATCSVTRPWAKWSRSDPKTAHSKLATASSSPSRSLVASAFSASVVFIQAASVPIPMPKRRRSYGDIRRRACLAIRICWEVSPVDRPSICACRMRMLDRSRSPKASAMTKCCFFPTSSQLTTWPPTSAI